MKCAVKTNIWFKSLFSSKVQSSSTLLCYISLLSGYGINAKTQWTMTKIVELGNQLISPWHRLHHIRRTWGPTSRLCPPRPRPQGQYLQGKADVNHSWKNMQMASLCFFSQVFGANHLHLWLQHLMKYKLV